MAIDSEPNDTPAQAQFGGDFSWPFSIENQITDSVQSEPPANPGDAPYDPVDYTWYSLDAGLRTVILRPQIDGTFGNDANTESAFGETTYLFFDPSEGFSGQAVEVVAKVGIDYEFTALGSTTGAYYLLANFAVPINDIGEPGISADESFAAAVIDEFDEIKTVGGGLADTIASEISGTITQFDGTTQFSPGLKQEAQQLVAMLNGWNDVHYYVGSSGSLTEVPFSDLGPFSDGFTWQADPGQRGVVAVEGWTSVSDRGGFFFDDGPVTYLPADVSESEIDWGSGVLPSADSLAAGQAYNLSVTDADTFSGDSFSLNGGLLGILDTLLFDGSAATRVAFIVVAGAADDTLKGGARDDTLTGGAGNDTIDGGGGRNTATYGVPFSGVTLIHNPDGGWTINAGVDGVDTLSHIQVLQFSDRTISLSAAAPYVSDFNGDGTSDLLFAQADGTLAQWQMSGTSITGGGNVGSPGGSWTEKAVGDFTGAGFADVLFQDASGALAIWEMNGTAIVGGGNIGSPGGTWTEQGVGDFNGDGISDILFRDAGGNLATWQMSGTAIIGGGDIGNPAGTWAVKGVGDFDGDGHTDILFADASGNLAIWEMNGTAIVGGGDIGNPGGTWAVQGVGDFNGDGRSDILFEDAAGEYAIWDMNGVSIIGGGAIGAPGGSWSFAGVGDYNGDGTSDILFKDASGDLAVWEMHDVQIIGGGDIGNPGSSWHVLG